MEADMSDEYLRLGEFHADVVFRGGKYGNMPIPGYKEDFQLVPKEMESYFIQNTLPDNKRWREPTVVPKFVDLPPLLREMLMHEANAKEIKCQPEEFKLPFLVKTDNLFSNVKYE